MANTRVSILGATGYGGGELLRLLLADPKVSIAYVTSRSKSGVPVGDVHRNLDRLTDLTFSDPSREQLLADSDVIFGALPHGASAETLAPLVDGGARVIDLSGDFRLKSAEQYKKWYKHEHPRPDLLETAVYGCPEFNREEIRRAKLVASPGCFATAINLSLLPAAKAGLLAGIPEVVAMTGSSGSGAEASEGTHHPVRAGTLRPYKVLSHQHIPECTQLAGLAGSPIPGINFTPISAPIVRGILAIVTCRLTRPVNKDEIVRLYSEFYASSRYVKVLSKREPECGSIAGTQFSEVRARITDDGRLHVVTAIDNLLKGGAGQALECFYLQEGRDKEPGKPLDWMGSWP
ncbi:N-acetyl-gamma-glutamyl-phosphate reductase [bacterium]|nr:N-acetyl-gamma-glutamyl-phosphate reductase [bacterium]